MTTFAFNKVIIRHGNKYICFSFRNIMLRLNLLLQQQKFNPLCVNSSFLLQVAVLCLKLMSWSNFSMLE